jgi:sensor histidine kinase YesM
MVRIIAGVLVVFSISVLMYRAVSFYYTFPYVYENTTTQLHLLDIPTVLVSVIDIGFIAGLAVALKFVRIQLDAREREKSLIKEKLETELKFLRNQVNPHFLLNTLNNIYALARKGADETAEVVLRLSELLQFMLYESSGKFITLRDEIKVFEGYLELEMIRYSERLSVSLHKVTDNDSYLITPFLLLPFVENAFKHGVSETRFESFVNIDITVKNGILQFMIENNYQGRKDEPPTTNIGLRNVRRQLELSYRDYKLDVRAEDQLFIVNLTLNLESHVEI